MSLSLEFIATTALAAALAGAAGYRLAAASRNARLRRLELGLRRSEQTAQQLRAGAEDLEARIAGDERRLDGLQRTLVAIPDVAQELAGTRRLREISRNALEFVETVFHPRYCVFYRQNRGVLIAVAARGDGAAEIGSRIRVGEGSVGYCAQTQLYLAPEDMPSQRSAEGAPAEPAFSLCVPVVSDGRTLAVILIGPCEQLLPQRQDLARTIALIASVVITSAEVLRAQSELAATDGLTALLNRTSVLERARALLRAKLPSVAFFLFDIDHFKQYNDGNGHLAGDDLLRSLSRLLRENTREEELVGRYGGEEFLIVIPNVERERASAAAERIRALIASTPFPHGEKQPGGCVSISGGISVWPVDGADLETLLRSADAALYAAKGAGRNRVWAHATPELGLADGSPPIAGAVARALRADELAHPSVAPGERAGSTPGPGARDPD